MLSTVVKISIIIVAILIVVIILEIFLAQKKNKRLGLIIPISGLLISFFVVLGYINFEPSSIKSVVYNGSNIIQSSEISENNLTIIEKVFNCILILLITNVPTVISTIIYLWYRKKRNKNLAIDKMKLQDL